MAMKWAQFAQIKQQKIQFKVSRVYFYIYAIFNILTVIKSDSLVRDKYRIKTCIKFNIHRA